jgi:Gram-negative porin
MAAVLFWPTLSLAQDAPSGDAVFTFYGQINRGFLYHNDGASEYKIPFVEGSKSPGRLGFTYDKDLKNGWHFQGRGEAGFYWKETDRVNQTDPNDSAYKFDKEALRKLEVSFAHAEYGKITVGQGPMAGSDAASQDLSLTNVAAGASVRGVAGGMYFRQRDGALSSFTIGNRFRTLGFSRTLRLRYDTPTKNGFTFAAAAGKEVLNDRDGRYYVDAALKYDVTKGDYRFKSAASIRWAGGNPDTLYKKESIVFLASGSLLHRPSRYNLTGSFGFESGGYFAYAKFGRRWYKLLPFGWTAASIDYYYTSGSRPNNFEGSSVGLAVVQKFKAKNFDIYATIRQYEYDDDTADYFDSLAFLTGLRWQF